MFVCLFGQRFLSNPPADSRQILHVSGRVFSPFGGQRPPGGQKEGKWHGGGLIRAATISIFLSDAKCSQCVGYRPAHILVQNRQDRPRGFYRMGQKVRKNFEFFTISRLYVHTSHKRLKIEAYKQRTENSFIPLLSNCRICMNQSLTGFYRVGQKLSDVIPVLRITPRATEPSTVSVFLSVVKCGSVCRAQTCAHSGIKPSTLAKGFPQSGPKSSKKFEFLTIS